MCYYIVENYGSLLYKDRQNYRPSAAFLLSDDDEKDVEAVVSEAGSRLRLSGRMALRVFLHPEATVLEAVEAIKEDIMRTVKARLEIHTDSLVGENGEAKWQEQANVSSI